MFLLTLVLPYYLLLTSMNSYDNNISLGSKASLKNMLQVLCTQRNGLNICHINAQSLLKKIDEFRLIFESSMIDVICISETWFNESIEDGLVDLKPYNLLRSDRPTHGGGV